MKKELRDLLEYRIYERVESYSKVKRGSNSGLYKSESREAIHKSVKEKEKDEKRERKEEKNSDSKEKKKKSKEKKEKEKERKAGKGGSVVGKEIGTPYNIQHKTHVDFDYKWTGQDPAKVFEFNQKLGEGYEII